REEHDAHGPEQHRDREQQASQRVLEHRLTEMGGSGRPPYPTTFGAPRHSRDGPRLRDSLLGGSGRPPSPPTLGAPRHSRDAPRSRYSVHVFNRHGGLRAPPKPPNPPTLGAPRHSRDAPRSRYSVHAQFKP